MTSIPPRGKPAQPASDSPDGLRVGQLYLDVAGRRLHLLNETARQLRAEGVPFSSAELSQQSLRRITGEPVLPEELPLWIGAHEGRPAEAAFVLSRRGKADCRVIWSASPVKDANGQTLGVVATVCCSPMPPDWQALAGLAHDLRTPLNALGLLLAVLDDPTMSQAQQRDVLGKVRSSADRAMQIGKELLEWCRAPHQKCRTAPAWFPLEPFLDGLLQEQLPAARRKALRLHRQLEALRGWEVLGDSISLARLIGNLLVNAVRYTWRGDIHLTAAWRGEDVLALGVVDTGAGISEEEQESIFQPFERGRAGREGDSGGSGLGLAVVDRLVAELGLEMEVQSEHGRGSAFYVLLPRRLLRQTGGTNTAFVPAADTRTEKMPSP